MHFSRSFESCILSNNLDQTNSPKHIDFFPIKIENYSHSKRLGCLNVKLCFSSDCSFHIKKVNQMFQQGFSNFFSVLVFDRMPRVVRIQFQTEGGPGTRSCIRISRSRVLRVFGNLLTPLLLVSPSQ